MSTPGLIGRQFGNWTVIEKLENGRVLCICNCKDKTVKVVKLTDLIMEKSTNCGCVRIAKLIERNSAGREKLEGQHFGEWDVLEYVGGKHYKCRCSCKRIKIVAARDLKAGISKSCGHNNGKSQFKDLTGRVFGELTVVKYLGYKIYECKCSCGNPHIVHRNNLL